MEYAPNTKLPYLQANQAQKHVTHNEAIRMLDILVQISVVSNAQTIPPEMPEEGSCYIVPEGGTGVWSNKQTNIAAWQDGAWAFTEAKVGWLAFNQASNQYLVFNNNQWTAFPLPLIINRIESIGINSASDTNNRLVVASNASLFNHEGENHRLKINKNAESDTASVIFQNNFSGRAEFGLAGSDNFSIKVSSNGDSWSHAIHIDKENGQVELPAGLRHRPSKKKISGFIPVETSSKKSQIYHFNSTTSAHFRSALIASVFENLISLGAPVANNFFNSSVMSGISYIRIWNLSKSPYESAWIKDTNGLSSLVVHQKSNISSWRTGDRIQIGEPEISTQGRVIAIDYSPMLISQFGLSFFANAAVYKLHCLSTNSKIEVSPDGDTDSFMGVNENSGNCQVIVQQKVKSPISDSNLVFIREAQYNTCSECGIQALFVS